MPRLAALAAREIRSMKPSAATRPRIAALARTRLENEMSLGSTFQILFSDCCISPKTSEAREELIKIAWPRNVFVGPRTVDVHISRLRRCFRQFLHADVIRT
ncbi:MAG: hypothetical protein EOQ40_34775, partial [Mesorhizobium sp.]